MLDKTYQPQNIEDAIYRAWEEANAFAAGRAGARARQALRHRHPAAERDRLAAYGACAQQHAAGRAGALRAHARARRAVAARHRSRRHRHADGGRAPIDGTAGAEPPRASGREAFIERVWQWKEESGNTIVGQLERLGCSCDWSRLRFTMDEGLSRAVRKVFVDLYRAGLIYKDKRLVNWDPELLTAISDLEVEQIETKGHLWHLRYPIEGRPGRVHRRRHHAARDHARRHRRRRASRRRALQASRRQERDPAAGRPPHPDHRRRILRPGEGLGRGEDHAGARLQRLRGRPAPWPADDQRAEPRRQAPARSQSRLHPRCRAESRNSRQRSSNSTACSASPRAR